MAHFWEWCMCHSMMQGSNENIKEKIGIVSISDYLIFSSNPHYTTVDYDESNYNICHHYIFLNFTCLCYIFPLPLNKGILLAVQHDFRGR